MTFEQIVKMTQEELKVALVSELRNLGYSTKPSDGYIYAKGKVPVMLVAHMDTVHKTPVRKICKSDCGSIYMSPEGIGGDDRSGVWMILQIVKTLKCHVLFCEDEESGTVGARAFVKSRKKPKVNYIVEIDRRGSNDAVFYDCDNPEFTKFVTDFGFVESFGSFSDISVIAPALGIAAVNISAGYWNEHSLHESVDMSVMIRNVDLISKMVATSSKKFVYIEGTFSYSVWNTSQTSYKKTYGKSYGKGFSARDFEYEDNFRYVFSDTKGEAKATVSLIPDWAYVRRPNGEKVTDASCYLVDRSGIVYEWLYDYDVAVKSEGYAAYRRSNATYKIYLDHKASFEVKVVTEDEAYMLMCDDIAIEPQDEDGTECKYVDCPGHFNKDDCMDCYGLIKKPVNNSTYTWNDIRGEHSDDSLMLYMEMVWDESGTYPQWDDFVPEWVAKLTCREAAVAS
jgi:hypothetical protein